MHPVIKFIVLLCGWTFMVCVILSMLLTPRLITKNSRRYPRVQDIRAMAAAGADSAGICRLLLRIRVVAIVSASLAVLIVAFAVARAFVIGLRGG